MVRSTKGKHHSYYEAILQLRLPDQEVVNFVEEELLRMALGVAKVVEIKTGLDYFLADNTLTIQLGKSLQKKFGGQLLTTSSLFSQKDGKELYRVTVLYRKPSFAKQDLVEYQGDTYTVVSMGKDILLKQKKTGQKMHVKYTDMQRIQKIEQE